VGAEDDDHVVEAGPGEPPEDVRQEELLLRASEPARLAGREDDGVAEIGASAPTRAVAFDPRAARKRVTVKGSLLRV
jgi:hypothetical protein